MQKAIVAIGGGQIRTRGTAPIDREIIRLTNKTRPKFLFIPTASSDSERYWKHVQEYFGGFLKCDTDVLLLLVDGISKKDVEKKINRADIIYVGVDKLLRRAYEKGTVLSGISAGAICWFDSGHSDSMSFFNPRSWNYINVKGLGLIKGIHCPHYNSRTRGVPRRKDFRDMILRTDGMGIAIENNCAIEFTEGRFYKVISSKEYARAYRVYKSGGQVVTERIRQQKQLAPIEQLYRRQTEVVKSI
jgi:dipeptidase E